MSSSSSTAMRAPRSIGRAWGERHEYGSIRTGIFRRIGPRPRRLPRLGPRKVPPGSIRPPIHTSINARPARSRRPEPSRQAVTEIGHQIRPGDWGSPSRPAARGSDGLVGGNLAEPCALRDPEEPPSGSALPRPGTLSRQPSQPAAKALASCWPSHPCCPPAATAGSGRSTGRLPTASTSRIVSRGLDVAPIPGRIGQRIRNELIFQASGGGELQPPTYRLEVTTTELVQSTLADSTGATAGGAYNLQASFKLVRLKDKRVASQGTSYGRAAFERFTDTTTPTGTTYVSSNARARKDSDTWRRASRRRRPQDAGGDLSLGCRLRLPRVAAAIRPARPAGYARINTMTMAAKTTMLHSPQAASQVFRA